MFTISRQKQFISGNKLQRSRTNLNSERNPINMINKKLSCYPLLFAISIFCFSNLLTAQNILTNPSFEIDGFNNSTFEGWQEIGTVDSDPDAYHGFKAAKVSGLDNDSWSTSAFWQQLDCETGEQWEISGFVKHTAENALTGDCIAMVRVEWYDLDIQLIDHEDLIVADAASSLNEYLNFNLLTSPSPTGTETIHLLIGILQSPYDPQPVAYYDQITFYSTSYPTIDDLQWIDFPDGRSLEFSERIWRVKGSGWYGPGPNHFSHLPGNVWVDNQDQLHLTIKYNDGTWYCTEVTLENSLGYGDYIFTTRGSIDQIDDGAVLGLFLWQYGPYPGPDNLWWNPYNEIDVEFSRWGNPGNEVGQFVAQPWNWQGNMNRFDAQFGSDELSSHAFNWLPDRIEFRSWHGGPEDENPQNMIHQWTYTGPHIPRPEQPRAHINLWKFGAPLANDQEVVINEFNFVPMNGTQETENTITSSKQFGLQQNYPNPFNPSTNIIYSLKKASNIIIEIFNLKGQKVKSLVDAYKPAGVHEIGWQGIDENGKNVATGIYFSILKVNGRITTKHKMMLLK